MIDTERYHSSNADSHIPSSPTDSNSQPNQTLIHSPSSNNTIQQQTKQIQQRQTTPPQQQTSMIKSESNQSISSPPSPLMTSSAPSTPLSDSGIVSNINNCNVNNINNSSNSNIINNSNSNSNSNNNSNNNINQPVNGSSRPGFQICSHVNHELWWNTSPELPVSEFYTRSYKCKRCYIKQQTESKKTRQSPNGNGNSNSNSNGNSANSSTHNLNSSGGNHPTQSYSQQHGYSSSNSSNGNSSSSYQLSTSNIENSINQTFSQNSSILGLATFSNNGNNKSQFDKKNGNNINNSKYLQKKNKQDDTHDFSGSDHDENYPINPNNYIDQVINSKQFSMYNSKQLAHKPPSPSPGDSDEKKIEAFHYMCSTYNHLVDRDTSNPGYIDSWIKGRLEQTEYFGTIRIQGNLGCNNGNNGANSKLGGFFTEIIVSGKTYRGLVFEDLKSSNQSNNYTQQQSSQQPQQSTQQLQQSQQSTQPQQSNNYSPSQSLQNKKTKGLVRDSSASFIPVLNSNNNFANENLEALLKLGKQAKNEAVEESKKRKKPYPESDYDDHQPQYALKSNYYS